MTARAGAITVLAVFAATLIAPIVLFARPGGGQSYSGSSSRSSSSSSSRSSSSGSSSGSGQGPDLSFLFRQGDAEIPEKILYGVFIGAVSLAFLGFAVTNVREAMTSRREALSGDWDSGTPGESMRRLAPPGGHWVRMRAVDPEFSAVLFEDFVYALYAAAHKARHDPDALARLAPYLSSETRAALHDRPPRGAPVEAVVVGAARVTSVDVPSIGDHLAVVEFEANVTARTAKGPRGSYLRERWALSRWSGARTRVWTGVRTLGCPSCGAPFTATGDARCRSCGELVTTGRFDWQVVEVEVREREERPPALLGEDVEEQGTDRPTVVDADLRAATDGLVRDDPGFSEPALQSRLELIYECLNESWAAQDLVPVRPYVSDAMFNYLSYWVEAYRAQGLRNAVESARIIRCETARLRRDRHFDAVTIRLWATGYEVTTKAATDEVLRGSRERQRPYSEYWTLIRGASVRGAARDVPKCPSCGALLDVNMAGVCAHCGVHVTSGEFDWVLSRIEQDDSYEG